MGNRILKETVVCSLKLSRLSWFEQVMFDHLIVTVDDYGVYHADPVLLSHILFPRQSSVTEKMVREGLEHMEAQGLILRYTAGGEEYLKLASWEKHQRLRNSRRKFPAPEEADPDIPEAEAETAPEGSRETRAAETAEPEVRELPVAEIPLNDGTAYAVSRKEAEEYAALYPAVDIRQELRNMRGWCLANPAKRKTRSGVKKFVNGWLSRAQDRGGSSGRVEQPLPENPFIHMATEGGGEEASGREKASGGDLFEKLFAGGTVQ